MADLDAQTAERLAQQLRDDDAEVRRLDDELKVARKRLADTIVAARKAGMAPKDVASHVSYDRNHIRRITEAAGIPPLREPTVRSRRDQP